MLDTASEQEQMPDEAFGSLRLLSVIGDFSN